jgi:hypothetical protein
MVHLPIQHDTERQHAYGTVISRTKMSCLIIGTHYTPKPRPHPENWMEQGCSELSGRPARTRESAAMQAATRDHDHR